MQWNVSQWLQAMRARIQRPVASAPATPAPIARHENPYVDAGKRIHNDRYLDLSLARRNWMIAALVLAGGVVVLSAALAWLAAQSRVQPYVAVVDDRYRVLSFGPAERVGQDEALLRRVTQAKIAEFIRNARSVAADPIAQVQIMDEVWAHAAADTRQMLSAYYADHNPGVAAQQGRRVSIEIDSVLLRSDRTWDVRWTEIEWDPSGVPKSRERWEARLAVDVAPPRDPERVLENPLGLYVTGLSWSRLLGSQGGDPS